ncbi:MAG: hypothetical protein RL307_61 [Pseudomonadota bacterium]|jgi:GntR family transcriptional regulator
MSTSTDPLTEEPAGSRGPAFAPLYLQIKSLILNAFQSGEWKPGEPIPSEMELANRYRVSQGTVRKAIDELAAENLVIRRQGKGTFVATHSAQHVRYRFLRLAPDVPAEDGSMGAASRTIIEFKRMRTTAELARQLNLRSTDSVFHLRRVLGFAGKPTILEDLWLPAASFKGLSAEQLNADRGPMYALFETKYGVRMVRAEERLRAVLPTAEQAQTLQLPMGTPLLKIERVAYTYHDQPMEVRQGLYMTEHHHYRNELN